MKVLHGTWIPSSEPAFIQTGAFYLWVETSLQTKNKSKSGATHPGHLKGDEFATFLVKELGIPETPSAPTKNNISPKYFLLPTLNHQPLPSLEMTRYLEGEIPEEIDWQVWAIECYQVTRIVQASNFKSYQVTPVIQLLNDLHFLALYNSSELQFGSDLLFWYHYTQSFKQVLLKDQYIPALKYRELSAQGTKGKRKPPTKTFEIYPAWQIISESYETRIRQYIDYMPLACVCGSASKSDRIEFYDKETLLRHFSECLLTEIVTNTPSTAAFDKKIVDSFIYDCVYSPQSPLRWANELALEDYLSTMGGLEAKVNGRSRCGCLSSLFSVTVGSI